MYTHSITRFSDHNWIGTQRKWSCLVQNIFHSPSGRLFICLSACLHACLSVCSFLCLSASERHSVCLVSRSNCLGVSVAEWFNLGRWIWNLEVPGSNPPPCCYLDLFSVVPSSTPRPRCVNSKLVSLPPVGILNSLCSIWNIQLLIYSVPN